MLKCFKAYDIRGRVPDELNKDIAYRIGRAFAQVVEASQVVIGRDVRLDSPALANAVARGLTEGGADVIDIGLCGTEEVYFQTAHRSVSGGIMVTASHNPMDYNGMKLVRDGARPISGDSGLGDIEHLVASGQFNTPPRIGERSSDTNKSEYIKHLLGYVDQSVLRPLKIVVNAGNGGAGLVIDGLAPHLPFEFIRIHHRPDGSFPNGIPNPLLPENRTATAEAVRAHGADLGIAWDGDFDRCFFFDAQGRFIEGYYLVGLLAAQILERNPRAKVVHDPRLTWNTIEMVREADGTPVMSKTGHAFIKERMRAEDAVYGGEMSAHHYFRDFAYCDSGMIPWLLVAERICRTNVSLAGMVEERMHAYPCSGEINFRVADTHEAIERVVQAFAEDCLMLDRTDGVSMEFADWRFNLRGSNTEPLLRLNVESRGNNALMRDRTTRIQSMIKDC